MCSPRAVGPELNVHFTFPLQCLQGFGRMTADRMYPHQYRTSTSHRPSLLAWLPETSYLVGSQKKRLIQTARKCLGKVHLYPCRPHQGLYLTAVHHDNQLQQANAHLGLRLALLTSTLFIDESWYSMCRRCMVSCRRSVWADKSYEQPRQVHFIDGSVYARR